MQLHPLYGGLMQRYNIVIPMAGRGTRFKEAGYQKEKPLIIANGKTLTEHAITSLGLTGRFIFITRNFENPEDNKKLTRLFDKLCRDYVEVRVNEKQFGAAHSASFAKEHIKEGWPLIIANCDQFLDWDASDFDKCIQSEEADGYVHIYSSKDPKNSFVMLDDEGYATEIVEKKVITSHALTGIHYWKNPEDFFSSFEKTFKTYKEDGYTECYVSITYNELIKEGKKIKTFEPHDNSKPHYWPIGTPEDVELFEANFNAS